MFGTPGWSEMLILGFIALLLFGKRLPEVARSLGQSFVEFKKGMKTFDTDMHSSVYSDPPSRSSSSSQRTARLESDLKPAGEKFEAPETTPAEEEKVTAE